MGEMRVDLEHLLEDLRDAYPGGIDETILTEVIANSLDSGARRIRIQVDPGRATLTLIDDGSGMKRRDLARYHDLATSTKTRGRGIGFAGVGIKLALLVCAEVVTETKRGASHAASVWHLATRHKAPWKWLTPLPEMVANRGTAVRLKLANALSPLLDPGFVEATIRRHFEPLLDPALDVMLRPVYAEGIAFEVDGRALSRASAVDGNSASIEIRLHRKRKPSAFGWLKRSPTPLPEDRRGVAISTHGKVIKRGWDWLGVSPSRPGHVSGLVEAPALAEALTLNKGDFIRTGARGSIYLSYRRAIQEAVVRRLEEWGDGPDAAEAIPRRAARPAERDLESVLVELADDFPMLASLVDRRLGGQRRLPMGKPPGAVAELVFADSVAEPADRAEATPSEPRLENDGGTSPAAAASSNAIASASGPKLPARYGLTIQFRSLPDDVAVARLVDATAWINDAHPAYRRAVLSRSEGYHLALAVALALAPFAAEPADHVQFVTAFLARWGAATEKPRGRGRRSAPPRPSSF